MSRTRTTSILCTLTAAVMSLNAAQARPVFIKFDGVDGECTSNSSMNEAVVGGQRVVQWSTPAGAGTLVLSPTAQNSGRPMETLSLNYTKISFNTVPPGASVGVSDDVIVDGHIITGALWTRSRKLADGNVRIEVGKAPGVGGSVEIIARSGGVPVASYICQGTLADCWFLVVTCPDLECSILCPSLCGVPNTSAPDPSGGVGQDLLIGGQTTFAFPGQAPVTADALSVVLHPARAGDSYALAGKRIIVEGLPGLQINSAIGEFACPADINNSGTLSVQDIFDFLAKYFAASPDADFNNSGSLSVQDLFDFLAAYFRGCE